MFKVSLILFFLCIQFEDIVLMLFFNILKLVLQPHNLTHEFLPGSIYFFTLNFHIIKNNKLLCSAL